jgi:hypothetical protein
MTSTQARWTRFVDTRWMVQAIGFKSGPGGAHIFAADSYVHQPTSLLSYGKDCAARPIAWRRSP